MMTFDEEIDDRKKKIIFFNSLAEVVKPVPFPYYLISEARKMEIQANARREAILANFAIWPIVIGGFLYFA
ncbi:MAG: hypothetical protein RIQ68_507 [Pseudomonadota bacterium]|jgi:hypothetical protein